MAANSTPPKVSFGISKIKTGIKGFDEVLYGGLPAKRTTLIKGSAGTGKTVLGLEFIYNQAVKGEPSILVCFEETAKAVRQNAASMGWDLEKLENSGKLFLWEAAVDRNAVVGGEFTIDSFLVALKGKAEQLNAPYIMIDAIDVLMSMFEDESKERAELYKLNDWLKQNEFTTILTAKVNPSRVYFDGYEILDYMTDCVLFLDLRVVEQVSTRRLRIIKYRGSGFGSNEYPYVITDKGSVIMPITRTQLNQKPSGKKISSGNENLDIALGGGYKVSSSILIAGPTGSGKTTCKEENVTCLMSNHLDLEGRDNIFKNSGFYSMLDSMIMLKYVPENNHVYRDLYVLKSRGTRHSNSHHLYAITDNGIDIKLTQNNEKGGG